MKTNTKNKGDMVAYNKLTRRAATAGLLSMALPLQGCVKLAVQQGGSQLCLSTPLVHYGARMAVEMAPIHLALRSLYGDNFINHNGGVANLVSQGSLADIASNGETQQTRHSVGADMRVLMTVAEGHYSILARRSAGINSLSDLRGKRVLSYSFTTSGFFLHKMLQTVGLTSDDVTIVEVPLGKVGELAASLEVDAIAVWEPDSEQALQALRAVGEDVIIFNGEGIYHERYNFCTTATALADPCKRNDIVLFARAIMDAVDAINHDPKVAAIAQSIVAESGGLYTVEEIAAGWPNVKFVAAIDDSLLELYLEQDVWLAPQQQRAPRSRSQLAELFDRSIYDEAKALK